MTMANNVTKHVRGFVEARKRIEPNDKSYTKRTSTPYGPGDKPHVTRQTSTTLRRIESTGTCEIDVPVTTIGTAPLQSGTAKLRDDDEPQDPHEFSPFCVATNTKPKIIRNGTDDDGSTRQPTRNFEF